MTMTAEQKAARLALIKQVAEKRQAKANFKKRLQTKGIAPVRKARSYVDSEDRAFRKKMDKLDENYNQWTDASSYAKEYYGDVYRDTTRFDNDWN